MYTQCPHCQTCFRIAEAHLKAAKGQVRCGSCKEIFDATNHLYEGVPSDNNKQPKKPSERSRQKPAATIEIKPAAAKPAVTPPPEVAPPQAPKPEISAPPPRYNEILPGTIDIPEEDHQHIDLSGAPDRSGAPDQSPFMESLIGDNSRYNNLDDIGPIDIPGNADFTESFIKYVGEDVDSSPEAPVTNPYTDTDSLESPATTQEQKAITDLYSSADEQLEEPNQEQIDKELEALLGGDLAFDDDHEKPVEKQPMPQTSEPLSDFGEPKLEPLDDDEPIEVVRPNDIWANADAAKTGHSKTSSSEADAGRLDAIRKKVEAEHEKIQSDDDLFDDFLGDNEPLVGSVSIDDALDNLTDLDNGFLDDDNQPTVATEIETTDKKASDSKSKEIDLLDVKSTDISYSKPETVLETESVSIDQDIAEDLPSLDHEIPKALRSSFENFEPPIRHAGLTMAMVAAIVVLILGVLGQSVLFRSYQLANQMPSLSPLLTSLCSNLPCRYSGSIDTTKIEVRNRDMRSHPSQKNALLVSTAIVNNAPFDQPYPILAVKLFDLSGHTVATRYFKPEEYLEGLYSKFLLMESGTPVHITLAVLDPGDDAVNFEITFQ